MSEVVKDLATRVKKQLYCISNYDCSDYYVAYEECF